MTGLDQTLYVRVPQTERRARSETKIVAATLKLVARKGIQGVTLAEAGALAGYSRGLPRHLFGTKSELLRRCAVAVTEQVWADMDQKQERPDRFSVIEREILAWAQLLVSRPDIARAYFMLVAAALREGDDDGEPFEIVIRDYSDQAQQRFRGLIADGQKTGEFASEVDADRQAWILHATLRGLGLQWLMRPELLDVQKTLRVMTTNLKLVLSSSSRLRS